MGYDEWKAEMENLFGKTEEYSPPTEKSASDETYLENLRRKIAETVKKQSKDFNQSEKQKELENKEKVANVETPPTNVNDFGLLKLREKAVLLVQKSAAKENEFEAIFKDIDNIDSMVFESDKKKKKGSKVKEEMIAAIAEKNELHCTEED